MGKIQFRELKSLEEFSACERIQEKVWGGPGVPGELLKVTQKYGGVVLGAVERGKVRGFIYAFLARRRGRLIHWSHLMAVEPGCRDRGLGFRMKLAHRRMALAQGVHSICWTYDPLQSRNAALNIGRLGGVAEEYIENCYGRFPSSIEKGLPSDRFVVEWKIATAAVGSRLRRKGASNFSAGSIPCANTTSKRADGFIENRRLHLKLTAPRILVEIPVNTDEIRSRNLRLAERWRLETRRIFGRYFSRGYSVVDVVPPARAIGRCYYVLKRK